MKTIRFLAVFFLLALVTFPPAAFPLEKLRLAYSGSGSGEEIHLIAQQAGIFKKHGLEVEIIRIAGGSTIVQAIVAGELQLGRGSAVEVVNAQLAGFPLKILSALINKFVYSFVTPPDIARPEDLRGKSVAISQFGDGSDFITRMALKSWGLEPMKDVAILQVGNSTERLAAVATRKVSGAILSLALAPRAKKLGLRVLADLSQIDAEYPQGVLYAPQSLIEKRPEALASFLRAYIEAIHYFKTNRQAAYDQIAKSSGIADRQDIAEYYDTLTKNFLQDNPAPSMAGVRTVLDQLAARNPRVRELKAENLVDTRFLPKK
ncbi:MAG TPA: ABC transporter substrate-binding protein [Candidatus Binatia bacterium]